MAVTDLAAHKRRIFQALVQLAGAGPGDKRSALAKVYHDDARWLGSHPMNDVHGIDAIAQTVWEPLSAAIPDLERRDEIFCLGENEHDGESSDAR